MKYYLYISDTKIDMLYPQVPHDSKKKTALELGFDLKVAKGSIKTEKDTEENRFTKLDKVLERLEESGMVGTVEEPKEYVRGVMDMRYAPWGSKGGLRGGFGNDVSPAQAVFVCFAGRTETTQTVLWGSWKHLIGESDESTSGHFPACTSSLATLAMWDYLDSVFIENGRSKSDTEEEFTYMHGLKKRADDYRGIRANAFQVYSPGFPSEKIPFALVTMVNAELRGPHQQMEFVARKVQHYSADGHICFLGTPLYVALG